MARDREQSKNITTYKERETATRGRHDNLRQVGDVAGSRKIYIEDYVASYIAHIARDKDKEHAQAVLLGKTEKKDDETAVYISGAVHIDEKFPEGGAAFSNTAWEALYGDIKKYFDGLEVVGWVRCVEEAEENHVDDNTAYIHQNQFSGPDKLLLLYAGLEKEMFFYVRSHGSMQWQPGYYIYYEKNEAMKNYRMDHQKIISEEEQYEDTVLEGIRRKMAKREREHAKKTAYIVGGAGVAAVTALLVLVAAMQNNAAKIQELETTIEAMTDSMAAREDGTVEKNGALETNAKIADSQIADTMQGDGINDRENERNDTGTAGDGNASAALSEGEEKETGASGTDKEEDELPDMKDGAEEEEKNSGKDENNERAGNESGGNADNSEGAKESDDKSTAVQASAIQGYYTVKKGDTLSQISCDFYHSVSYTQLICEANDIHDADAIFEGQVLAIPKKQPSATH